MPESNFKLTDEQREAVGQVMADNFGCNFQTGEYAGGFGIAYVAWKKGPNYPTKFVYIHPDGTVSYNV